MRFLALLLLGPWLAVLGWLYWTFPRAPLRGRRGFDVGVLLLASVAAFVCAGIAFGLDYGAVGTIWKQVAAALAAYAGFSVVLFIAWSWRARRRARNI